MEMRLKMNKRSCRYDMNSPRPRHGHKNTKYKIGPSVIMVICINEHLKNI